jgi:hypothetical protein
MVGRTSGAAVRWLKGSLHGHLLVLCVAAGFLAMMTIRATGVSGGPGAGLLATPGVATSEIIQIAAAAGGPPVRGGSDGLHGATPGPKVTHPALAAQGPRWIEPVGRLIQCRETRNQLENTRFSASAVFVSGLGGCRSVFR